MRKTSFIAVLLAFAAVLSCAPQDDGSYKWREEWKDPEAPVDPEVDPEIEIK